MSINGTRNPASYTGVADGTAALERPNIGRHASYPKEGLIGYIAEAIYYNYSVNAAQLNIINSYLAAKYSINIANIKYDYGTAFGFDVAGIGREDASNIHNDAMSANILSISNATGLVDGSYLMFGHNNGSTSAWTSTGAPANAKKIDRNWRFTKTGTVNTVDASVNLSSPTFDALPAGYKYVLMVKSNGDFTTGAKLYEMDNTCGSNWKVPSIVINDGDYLSIGIVEPKVQFALLASDDFEFNPAKIAINLNFTPINATTVKYSTNFGTTTSGDFTSVNAATATIPAYSSSETVTINITNDISTESDESFSVTLYSPSAGYTLGDDTTHTYTIHDDDASRKIFFTGSSSKAAESVTSFTLTVSLDPSQVDHVNPTTVDYTVSSLSTATGGGVDYTLASGKVTILKDYQTATITIPIIDDGIAELDETIIVSLNNPTNCNLSSTNPIDYTYTILDNDIFGYKGPGGVGNKVNNLLWLKADVGVYRDAGTAVANINESVQQWNDQSGNGNNASQVIVANKPIYKTLVGNSKPALYFNINKSIYPAALGDGTTNWTGGFTYFTVLAPTNVINYTGDITADNDEYIIDRFPISDEVASLKFVNVSGIGPKLGFQKRAVAGAKSGCTAPNTVTPSLLAPNATFTLAQYYRIKGQGYYITTNGNEQSNSIPNFLADGDADYKPPQPYIGGFQGGTTIGFQGYIAEVAVYNGTLNSTQRLIIDNYLSVKYNIPMEDNSRKKYAFGATTFRNELAGIGRISANSYHLDAQGSGFVRINHSTSLDDNDFLLWAHDNGDTAMISGATNVDGTVIKKRMTRKWKVDINGNADGVGTVTVTFDFTTFTNTISPLPYFLMIDRNGNGFADNDVTPILGTTVGKIVTFTNVAFNNGDIFTIGYGNVFSWTGTTNKDWGVPTNWSASIPPTFTTSVIIPASCPNYPEINSSAIAQCVNIDIQSGAWVTVPAGKTLLVSNTMNIQAGGTFTLKSDATGTATLIENGITQSGTANVECYFSGNHYHYISSPLSAVTAGSVASSNHYYSYNEANALITAPAYDWMKGWVKTNPSDVLSVAKGYALYYGKTATFTFTGGTLNTGNKSILLTNSSPRTTPVLTARNANGWNLIGNPYPSPINANQFIDDNASCIDGALYFWTYNGNTGWNLDGLDYACYTKAGGVNLGLVTPNSQTLPSLPFYISQNQGFFVHKLPLGVQDSIKFNNAQRFATTTKFFKGEPFIQRMYLSLSNKDTLYNQTLLAFTNDATINFDNQYDAIKLKGNSKLSLFSLQDIRECTIQAQPLLNDEDRIIPIGVETLVNGELLLNLENLEKIDPSLNIYLLDKSKNKFIDLRKQKTYNFIMNAGIDKNRFKIVFTTKDLVQSPNIHLVIRSIISF